jgi:hypothetical protein
MMELWIFRKFLDVFVFLKRKYLDMIFRDFIGTVFGNIDKIFTRFFKTQLV